VVVVGVLSAILLKQYPDATQSISTTRWYWAFALASVLLLLLLSLAVYHSRETTRHKREAAAATAEARVRYKDIGVQAGGIGSSVERAQFYLDVAAREFAQHRYAPFWDAMEAAATAIGQCHACQGYLAFDIDQYVNVLGGRLHDFPSWDHAVSSIPEIEPALGRFAHLKNEAESDYQFASMREFRETRQVMIAGFKTLGEALRHLEHAVVDSISDLKRAVDRSLLLRAADPAHIHVVARFLIGNTPPAGGPQ
jgi:hypothetical protein